MPADARRAEAENTQKMLTQPPFALVVRFAAPAIFTMLMTSLYNMVDRVFVGNGVGYLGLAAVTACAPVMTMMTALSLLFGAGGSALFSIRLGEGDRAGASRILSTSLFVQLAVGLAEMALGLWLHTAFCRLTGTTAASEPYADRYLQVIFMGAVPQCIGAGLINFIRAEGNPRFAMFASLTGTAANCILDPLFIFGLKMGVTGAAMATVIAQTCVALMIIFYYTAYRSAEFHFSLPRKAPAGSDLPEIARLGFSSFMTQVASCIMSFLCMNKLSYYGELSEIGGDVAVSSVGIALIVGALLVMFGVGMQQAVSALIGINYGAGQSERVYRIFLTGLGLLLGILMVCYAILMIFAHPIVLVFGDVQNVDFAAFALRGYHYTLPFCAFQMLGCAYFQATGQAGKANILSIIRPVGFSIPLLLMLPPFFGLNSIILCEPIADFGAAVVSILMLLRERRKLVSAPSGHLPTEKRPRM